MITQAYIRRRFSTLIYQLQKIDISYLQMMIDSSVIVIIIRQNYL